MIKGPVYYEHIVESGAMYQHVHEDVQKQTVSTETKHHPGPWTNNFKVGYISEMRVYVHHVPIAKDTYEHIYRSIIHTR